MKSFREKLIDHLADETFHEINWAVANDPKEDSELIEMTRKEARNHHLNLNEQEVEQVVNYVMGEFIYYRTPIKTGTYSQAEEKAKLERVSRLLSLIDNPDNAVPMAWPLYKKAFPLFGRGDYQDHLDRFLADTEKEAKELGIA